MKMILLIATGLLLLPCFLPLHAQPGQLDLTFNGTGKVITDIAGANDLARSVVVQTDGKILVAGTATTGTNTDFALARYNPDGTPDNTFSSDGKLTTDITGNDEAVCLLLLPDGKIIVAGNSTPAGFAIPGISIVRYNSDGTPDITFSGDGKVNYASTALAEIYAGALQKDGRIVVAGFLRNSNDSFLVARFNTDGTPDNTFNGTGKQTTRISTPTGGAYAQSVAIQPADGKIVVAGYCYAGPTAVFDFALARYNTNGTLDNTFSGDGVLTTDFAGADDHATSVIVLSDGKIIASGYTGTDSTANFALARYNADGTPDNTFGAGGNGRQTTAIGPVGVSEDFALAMAVQKDGKILLAGFTRTNLQDKFALVRYGTDGRPDNAFGAGGNGVVITDVVPGQEDECLGVTLQKDGKILLAGTASNGAAPDFAVVRYQNDIPSGGFTPYPASPAAQRLMLYPNPATARRFTLQSALGQSGAVTVGLYDARGNLVCTPLRGLWLPAGEFSRQIIVPDGLPAGAYTVVLITADGGRVHQPECIAD